MLGKLIIFFNGLLPGINVEDSIIFLLKASTTIK